MVPLTVGDSYKVLAADDAVYGPVSLDGLIQWVQEGRVLKTTWVLSVAANDWHQASQLAGIAQHFDDASAEAAPTGESATVSIEELRQFERLSVYSNADLECLLKYCDVLLARKGEVIIKKGDLSDALFLLLSGEVRARLLVGRHDSPLGNMAPGEVFGEVAMLSHTPRTADVVAETDSRVLRLTSENFQRLMEEQTALSARMLFNMARSIAKRLAERNTDLAKEIASAFVWH